MKNILSFETAKRLKSAGFPQPETYEFGQVYYFPEDERFGYDCFAVDHTMVIAGEKVPESFYFAPTATDILREMRDGWRLTRVNQDMFICTGKEALLGDDGCKYNPAEAAALAWLSINEK